MKKILALVMILCALVVGMTGCSNNSEPEATEAPTEELCKQANAIVLEALEPHRA